MRSLSSEKGGQSRCACKDTEFRTSVRGVTFNQSFSTSIG